MTKHKMIKHKRCVGQAIKNLVAGRQFFKCANNPNYSAVGCEGQPCPCWNRFINQGSFDGSCFEIDHILELSNGGDNSINNLQALCPNCHSFKTKKNTSIKNNYEEVMDMDIDDYDINITTLNLYGLDDAIENFINSNIQKTNQYKNIVWIELREKFKSWCIENSMNKYSKTSTNKLKDIFIKLLFNEPCRLIMTNNGKRKLGWKGYALK